MTSSVQSASDFHGDPVGQFREFCQSHGLELPNDFIADGGRHRCGTVDKPRSQNGAYKLHLDPPINGGCQNWEHGDEWHQWRPDNALPISDAERERIQTAKREREAIEAQKKKEAQERAQEIWESSQPANPIHPYLARKTVDVHGIRQKDNSLIVPLKSPDGILQSIQFISPDGQKRFLPGGRKKGCYHLIGEVREILCISEGYATGVSIHEVTGHAVAIAFDAGNLLYVATSIRKLHPDIRLVLCADNDSKTKGNPGVTKATEAARAVDGLIAIPPIAGDFNDLASNPERGGEAVRKAIEQAKPPDSSDDKTTNIPDPIKTYTPYPVDVLPEPLRSYVKSAAASIGCDTAYIALPLFSVMASGIGATRRVAITPDWVEPSVIWSAIIGDSGSQKSPALKSAIDPVDDLQKREYAAYQRDLKEWEVEIAERDKKDKTPEPPRPLMPTRYVGDITVEAIAVRLLDWPQGFLLYRDELSGHFKSFNQYKKGHGGDEGNWLSMHNADAVRTDRKTGDKSAIYVPMAAVSITGSIQPGILADCIAGTNTENGMLARFIICMPPRRKRRLSRKRINQNAKLKVRTVYRRLTELQFDYDEHGSTVPIDLPLSSNAQKVFNEWFDEHSEHLSYATGAHAAALSKIEHLPARLSLIIQLVRWANGNASDFEIDEDSMQAGITLARWHRSETTRVYGLLRVGSESDRKNTDVLSVINRLGGSATPKEIRNSSRKWRDKSEDLERTLQGLAARGFLEQVYIPPGKKGGRPTIRYSFPSHDSDSLDTQKIDTGIETSHSSENTEFRFRYHLEKNENEPEMDDVVSL